MSTSVSIRHTHERARFFDRSYPRHILGLFPRIGHRDAMLLTPQRPEGASSQMLMACFGLPLPRVLVFLLSCLHFLIVLLEIFCVLLEIFLTEDRIVLYRFYACKDLLTADLLFSPCLCPLFKFVSFPFLLVCFVILRIAFLLQHH